MDKEQQHTAVLEEKKNDLLMEMECIIKKLHTLSVLERKKEVKQLNKLAKEMSKLNIKIQKLLK